MKNNKVESPCSWDYVWINLVDIISQKSKDPQSKIGAVIVSPDNRKVAIGFNGFARKITDTKERWTRENKYPLVIHAEENCILNSTFDLQNCVCYVSIPPCPSCAVKLIQVGISKVIYKNEYNGSGNKFDFSLSKKLFQEANVEIIKYDE